MANNKARQPFARTTNNSIRVSIGSSGMQRFLIIILALSFLVPGTIDIGTLTFGMPRLLLTIVFVPTLIAYARLRKGTQNLDRLVLFYCIWITLSLAINNGFESYQFSASQVVEILGGYLFARVFIDTIEKLELFWSTLAVAAVLTLPAALVELFTNTNLFEVIFQGVVEVFPDATVNYRLRLGFQRVQGNLEHPILFGIFWSIGFLFYLTSEMSYAKKIAACLSSITLALLSLSTGAYLYLGIALCSYIYLRRKHSKLSVAVTLIGLLYIVLELITERPLVMEIATRISFDPQTAYWRAAIFEYGIKNIASSPVFGIGTDDWQRPAWLTTSVDNYWLLTAMQFGLPAFILLAATIIEATRVVRQSKPVGESNFREAAIASTLIAAAITLATVSIWASTKILIWIIIGLAGNAGSKKVQDQKKAPIPKKSEPAGLTRFHPVKRSQSEEDSQHGL